MCIGRMKSGFYGLKATQASLILIGFVCIAVIGLAWTKTSLLTSLGPPQIHILHLSPAGQDSNDKNVPERKSSPEQLEENPSTVQEINLAKTFPSANFKDNISSASVPDDKQDIPPSATEGTRAEVSENINSSKVGGDDNVTPGSSLSPETHAAATPEDSKYSTRGDDNVTLGSSLSPETHTAVTSPKVEDSKDSTNYALRKDCNLSKGKWVIDESRPLYSGFGCKQWLSSIWACRLTQRTDFEYEKLRWQPKDCEMDDFTGPKFLERMQHKTLAFVGDSLGRQQFQSLTCMITGGENRPDVLDVGNEYGLVKARGAKRPDGWAYRFPSTNTTVLYYWSASLCDLQPIDSSNDVAMHLDRPPWFLQHYIHRFDVLVLNTGHHWNRGKINANHWIMHVGGVPNTNRKIAEIGGAKNLTVYSTIAWVNSQLPKYPGLKAFYRSISPRHFFNGDWNTGGTCDNTTPLAGGKEVIEEESIDPLAAGAVKGTGVKLLDITALSQLRDEGHISRYSIKASPGMQDCLHWCLPGVPDTWNEILFAQI